MGEVVFLDRWGSSPEESYHIYGIPLMLDHIPIRVTKFFDR
jgi:hypothetical protein